MNAVECEKSLRKELIGEVSDDTFRKNYLIEAGAGAGKTFILSNRIVNQILHDQASPDELVAITFTEKAISSSFFLNPDSGTLTAPSSPVVPLKEAFGFSSE